jgi:hypothetical protein
MPMKHHWQDKYIFGEPGFWYVRCGEHEAGYFSSLRRARQFVSCLDKR